MATAWHFEWITDWDTVWSQTFLDVWRRMLHFSSAPHVFYEPSMVKAWFETFIRLQEMSPRFMLATDGSGHEALLPLVSVRSGWKDAWRRTLSPVGQPGFDYRDPVFLGGVDQQGLAVFWAQFEQELERRWKGTFDLAAFYQLRAMDADSSTFAAMPEAIVPPQPNDVAPAIQLNGFGSLDEYLATRSTRFRRDIQSGIRRLDESFHVEYRVFAENEIHSVLDDVPKMLEVNRRRWPMTWRAKGYYENLVRHAMPAGLVHYSRLELDGTPISWHLGFRYRGRLCWYLPSFRDAFRELAPGKMHIAFALRDSIGKGITVFDFMLGNEPYKLKWANSTVEVYAFKKYGRGMTAAVRNLWCERAKRYLVRSRRFIGQTRSGGNNRENRARAELGANLQVSVRDGTPS